MWLEAKGETAALEMHDLPPSLGCDDPPENRHVSPNTLSQAWEAIGELQKDLVLLPLVLVHYFILFYSTYFIIFHPQLEDIRNPSSF